LTIMWAVFYVKIMSKRSLIYYEFILSSIEMEDNIMS